MTHDEMDQLILRIPQGDPSALESLYKETRTAVYGVAYAITRDTALAEDVTHDVYLNILKFSSNYKPNGKGKAWILRITRNIALTIMKKRKNQVYLEDNPELTDCQQNNIDDNIILRNALNDLKPRECEIVILYAVSGFSHKEISELLNMAYPTTRWNYHNAIKKLRRIMKRGESYEK